MKKFFSCIIALMMVMFAAVPAFAASDDVKSPQGTLKYLVDVEQTNGGHGSYNISTGINENGEQVVIFTANTEEGYKFDHWEFDGKYRTDGSLNDSTLELVISSDIIATPYFVSTSGSTEPTQAGTTVVVQKDTSPSSPQTGRNDAPLYAIILFAVAACGVATVKFVKSK